jgi:hypothetical protein
VPVRAYLVIERNRNLIVKFVIGSVHGVWLLPLYVLSVVEIELNSQVARALLEHTKNMVNRSVPHVQHNVRFVKGKRITV